MEPYTRSRGSLYRLLPTLLLATACAELGSLPIGGLLDMAGVAPGAALDDPTIVAGLKEALQVGTDRTVSATSRENGYLGNALIRIALPKQLDTVAQGLRAVGLGIQVDELEVAMNRAAERAATDYFQERTSAALTGRFHPIVEQSMQQVGLVQLYDGLLARVSALPLVPTPNLDLDAYVTDHALQGLFTVLAEEEGRICSDPAARSTDFLRTVFGGR